MPSITIRKGNKSGTLTKQELIAENALLRKQVEELKRKAMSDPLTGIGNFNKMNESLHEHVTDLTRIRSPLSVVILDMDGLKEINDTHGHHKGNSSLIAIARALKRSARSVDVICRIGGDEFIAILPYTGEMGAIKFSDRVKAMLEKRSIIASSGSATIQGIISQNTINKNVNYLLESADERMYADKKTRKEPRNFLRA